MAFIFGASVSWGGRRSVGLLLGVRRKGRESWSVLKVGRINAERRRRRKMMENWGTGVKRGRCLGLVY